MSQKSDLQRVIHQYRLETGEDELDMHVVAKFAVKYGFPLPTPQDPLARLAKQLAKAARDEVKRDTETGLPYRVNHALRVDGPNGQVTMVWFDIDHASRKSMHKSLVQRREQMVGDAVQLTFDADHWNSRNPKEEPITLPMDFAEDIEWAKNADDKAAE